MNTSVKLPAAISQYLNKLNERDRLALLALTVFIALLIVFYGLLQPANNYRQQARDAYQLEQELLTWLQARQSAIAQLQSRPLVQEAAGSNTLSTINSSAGQFKLSIKRVQPESNGNLRVWMEEANFDNTLRWLHHLQQQGIGVSEINLDQSGPGSVNLRATFSS
ncbi:type II secretion system protein M [Pseudomaricurvus alcaniphilus]|uniref:type II secretion system protein GspM n=1 Tax=Pseudomaricurvus alcaniphilus TaxID=1166482 RepID=UPI00140D8AA7|nr:type II secretion system protein M [Pseudomaricurvus alcaniphilus]NHN38934.1 type II secretion system protein M [Pseudomaricurvus alcaniphilus]